MAKLPMSPVWPLGWCKVVTPGTKLSLLQLADVNYPGALANLKSAQGQWGAKVYQILFAVPGSASAPAQIAAGNVGTVYFGTSNMNRAAATGLGIILPMPKQAANAVGFYTWTNPSPNNEFRLEDYFLDADNASDGAFVTVWVM